MKTLYFNHSSICPMIPQVRCAIDSFLDLYMVGDFVYLSLLIDVSNRIKAHFATLVGTNSENVALLPNTPIAISSVMMGFPFNDGDHVIIVENDFPSVSFPFVKLRKEKNLSITVLNQQAFYKDPLTVLSSEIKPNTRLFEHP